MLLRRAHMGDNKLWVHTVDNRLCHKISRQSFVCHFYLVIYYVKLTTFDLLFVNLCKSDPLS